MGRYQAWLSEAAETLAAELVGERDPDYDCDVLVVGSGYGGAVAAARLSGLNVRGANRVAKVWVLERGREHPTGSFPSQFGELPGEVRYGRQDGKPARGFAEGLFDVRLGPDVSTLVGNGLGGGSLINAGVMEPARPEVFDAHWPVALRADPAVLTNAYIRASEMLQTQQMPEALMPNKLKALERTATALQATTERCHLAVNFTLERISEAGVSMRPCTSCGDCITGCNQGAKGTLDTNYLALAWRRRARLFCGAWVQRVVPPSRDGGAWTVQWNLAAPELRDKNEKPFEIRARHVILAAGSLGSTEILLRSSDSLPLSRRLGQRFSTNGDSIAAGYRQTEQVNACGDERVQASGARNVGPTITGMVRTGSAQGPLVIEDFAVPASLKRVMGEVTTTFGLLRELFAKVSAHEADQGQDRLAVTTSSLEYTSIYGLMGDDGAGGELNLVELRDNPVDGAVRIHWADRAQLNAVLQAQIDALSKAAETTGGRVVPNPGWQPLPHELRGADQSAGPVLTVHPLGGCPMGDDVASGVVDSYGRVYDPRSLGGGFHAGLAVLDGSIVPTALGINPALTIAALAERASDLLQEAWGFERTDEPTLRALPPRRVGDVRPLSQLTTGIALRERMTGRLELAGRSHPVSLDLSTHAIQDLRGWLCTADRELAFKSATLRGFDEASSQTPVESQLQGTMQVLSEVEVPDQESGDYLNRIYEAVKLIGGAPGESFAYLDHLTRPREIKYRLEVVAGDGAGLQVGDELIGLKRLQYEPGDSPWNQLSRLTLHLKRADVLSVVGTLETSLSYFAQRREALVQLASQRDQPTALLDLMSFALYCLRTVLSTSLPKFAVATNSASFVDERKIGHDASWVPTTVVGVDRLILWRRGDGRGKKGRPLLMIHGLSAAGSTFANSRMPRNIADGLPERDLWIVDLRTSAAIDPNRPGPFKFEEIARQDVVRVIDKIATTTGKQVDVLAHCIGAAMFSMAVLSEGWPVEQIGRVVLSQVGLIPHMSPFNLMRGFIMNFLQQVMMAEELDVRPDRAVGADGSISSRDAGGAVRLLDALLATFPYPPDSDKLGEARLADLERDFRLVRHRADAMMGQTLELDNLASETLEALDAHFGWVKTRTLLQAMHLAREEVLTNASGHNEFVARDRLRTRFGFPVLMLHGKRNRVFHWTGSKASYDLLKEVFGEAPGDPTEVRAGRHWGQETRRQLLLLNDYGHQDSMIGKSIADDVLPAIESFLSEPDVPEGAAPAVPKLRPSCEPPWIGPILGWVRPASDESGACEISVLVQPGPRHVDTLGLVLVPVLEQSDDKRRFNYEGVRLYRIDAAPNQRQSMLNGVFTLRLRQPPKDMGFKWVALTLHSDMDKPPLTDLFRTARETPKDVLSGGFELSDISMDAVRSYLEPPPPGRSPTLDTMLLCLEPQTFEGCLSQHTPTELTFALASCQYPPGLFDKWLASSSMQRLRRDLDAAAGTAKPAFMLLAGDQVYLDALATAFDSPYEEPTDVARRAYESSWRLPGFRYVASRLPMMTMLDDHEVADNWQPGNVEPSREHAALAAFKRYQAVLNPPRLGEGTFSYMFQHSGHPFFVLDTRTGRERRSLRQADEARPIAQAHIASVADRSRLADWLRCHRDRPIRFIVSPSVVLPLEQPADASDADRLGLDSWSGYPASLRWLLAAIREIGGGDVVILSGDAHMSMACKLTLDRGPRVFSIVSSGLYTPWPFANARVSDFILDGLVRSGNEAIGCMSKGCASDVAGYAAISIERREEGFALSIEFRHADGSSEHCSHQLWDPSAGWQVRGTHSLCNQQALQEPDA